MFTRNCSFVSGTGASTGLPSTMSRAAGALPLKIGGASIFNSTVLNDSFVRSTPATSRSRLTVMALPGNAFFSPASMSGASVSDSPGNRADAIVTFSMNTVRASRSATVLPTSSAMPTVALPSA